MKRIQRSQNDRIIAGVCGGFSEYFGIDPTLTRLGWIFFTLFGGSGILAYILAIIIIPEEGIPVEKGASASQTLPKNSNFWGIMLIVVGIILLVQHHNIYDTIVDAFWGSGLNAFISIILIAIGIYLITAKQRDLTWFNRSGNGIPLHLSRADRKIAGVCGGLSESVNLDSNIIRLVWVLGTFMTAGTGLLIYLILAVILPSGDPTKPDQL